MSAAASAPLAGRRIWLARAAGRGHALAERLRAMGASVESQPAIDFELPSDEAPARAAVENIARYGWVLFSSATGVRFFAERLGQAGVSLGAVALRVAVVGPATALAARQVGLSPAVVAARSTAEGLAEALAGSVGQGSRLLLVRPEVARPVLAHALEAMGCIVDAVPFYRSVSARGVERAASELSRAGYDAVVFGSPSTVRGAWGADERDRALLERVRVIAIGPVTAAALEAVGRPPDAIATEPNDDAIVEAVLRAFAASRG